MTEAQNNIEIKRKRLVYQSWYRGCKETDRILGTFAKKYLHNYNAKQLDEFEDILDENDRDIFDWLTGKSPVPEKYTNYTVMQQLMAFHYSELNN